MSLQLSSYTLRGTQILPIQVEVDARAGMPNFTVIGLASTSVQESRDRVRSAIQSSHFEFPMNRKVVNLAPAEVHKTGSHFDLPIAIGFLVLGGVVSSRFLQKTLLLGELGLGGELRAVRGALPALLWARDQGFERVIFPAEHAAEFDLIRKLGAKGLWQMARSLREVVSLLNGEGRVFDEASGLALGGTDSELHCAESGGDFATNASWTRLEDIVGQTAAKRALKVAAAGGHHLVLGGSPGVGKTLLGQALASLLPPLSLSEQIEVESLRSVAGGQEFGRGLGDGSGFGAGLNHGGGHGFGPSSGHRGKGAFCLSAERPFRMTHPRMSPFAFFGGGAQLIPGEVSLAHRGVLFMDELPEFSREVIEGLRGPLEGRPLELKYGKERCSYPCQFQLIAAYNPCPCGYFGDEVRRCVCSGAERARYARKLSGPLVDRIDLHLHVPRLEKSLWGSGPARDSETSTQVRGLVEAARERQRARGQRLEAGSADFVNAHLTARHVQKIPLSLEVQSLLDHAMTRLHFSARGAHRALKVALTLADLAAQDEILPEHIQEALMYRLPLD